MMSEQEPRQPITEAVFGGAAGGVAQAVAGALIAVFTGGVFGDAADDVDVHDDMEA